MKKENTSIRLKKIMEERNLKQIDILNLVKPFCQKYGVKMNKSDISQYCSGKTEPNQNKLYVLSQALNVSEAWLMGFEVEQDRVPAKEKAKIDFELINKFHKLNSSQQTIVMQLIDQLIQGGD